MGQGNPAQAVAYLRTSSAANVGADRDSEKRQRQAIETYAKRARIEIVGIFYDAAVSGSPKGHQRSLREGPAELLEMGFANASGRPFSASSVRVMTEA